MSEQPPSRTNRRLHFRFGVARGTPAVLADEWPAALVDLSVAGALIEHTDVLRPGAYNGIELDLEGRPVNLRFRVVRSKVANAQVLEDVEGLVYHTGIEFQDVSQNTWELLRDYLKSRALGGGKG